MRVCFEQSNRVGLTYVCIRLTSQSSDSHTPSMCSVSGGLSQATPTESCRDVFTAGTLDDVLSNGSVSSVAVVMLSALGGTVNMVTPRRTAHDNHTAHVLL